MWSAPVAFRRVALETPEWTSRDSNHHRQSVSVLNSFVRCFDLAVLLPGLSGTFFYSISRPESWTRLHCSELHWCDPVALSAGQPGAPVSSKACSHRSYSSFFGSEANQPRNSPLSSYPNREVLRILLPLTCGHRLQLLLAALRMRLILEVITAESQPTEHEELKSGHSSPTAQSRTVSADKGAACGN